MEATRERRPGIWLDANENPRGPSPLVLDALRSGVTRRLSRGFPPDHRGKLIEGLAERWRVSARSVLIGTGSGLIIEAIVRAACGPRRPVVTASPTYAVPECVAARCGAPVIRVAVDQDLRIDLPAMARAAIGAGVVYLCNPNNPTGTVQGADALFGCIDEIAVISPDTVVLVDEAYIEYATDPGVDTAIHVVARHPNLCVTRSFSKVYGLAGMRLGYAIGHARMLERVADAMSVGSVGALSALAGVVALGDASHVDGERRENERVKQFTVEALRSNGIKVADSQSNCLFVETNRPSADVRRACARHGIHIGRDFPPFERTHCRITLGTMDEMRRSVEVLKTVLA